MEEINLKEIIETLLKGKYIILISTLVALAVGAVVYALTPAQYKTTVSILANPIVNINNAGNDAFNQFALPSMDISAYRQQFLNNYTLRKTIEELDLRDKEGEYISNESIYGRITVNNPDKTNILDVGVVGEDADQITRMANALGKHFINYITEVYQTSAGASAKALEAQLKTEEKNLDREAGRLKDYLQSSDNMDTLNAEITSLIGQITQYKANLNNMEQKIEADRITAVQLRERTGCVVGNTIISAVLTNDTAFTGDYQMELNAETLAELEQVLYTLKLADVEARLIENINGKDAIARKIDELEDRLSDLQSRTAEEQYKYNAIQRDLERAENTYNTYTEQYQNALAVEAANLGNANIKIISEAVVPVKSNKKNILLTVSIAGVLGLFIGMFAALFKGYWTAADMRTADDMVVREQDGVGR